MGCCCPTNLAYSWSSYSLALTVYGTQGGFYRGGYNASGIESGALGRGKYAVQYPLNPPLLGTGGTTIPRQGDWVSLSQANIRGYGVLADGSLWGWGLGPIGDGTLNSSIFPKKISSGPWRKVSTSGGHTVALKRDGTVWTWGTNTGFDEGDFGERQPRAVLNSSVESLDVLDFSVTYDMFSIAFGLVTSIQPSRVSIQKDYYGEGASVSCSILYSLTFDDNFQLYRYTSPVPSFSSPPSVVVTPDARDTASKAAKFDVAMSESGTISSISCTFGGEYMYLPSVVLSGTLTGGASFSQNIRFGVSSTQVDMAIVSGGSGYSHRITSPARVVLTLPSKQEFTAAMINLSPSSVSRIDEIGIDTVSLGNGKLFTSGFLYGYNQLTISYLYSNPVLYGMADGRGILGDIDYSSVVPSAKLVSHEDEDLPLAVVPVNARNGVWNIVFPAVPPVRKTTGVIQVTWPSYTYPQVAPLYSGGFGRGGWTVAPSGEKAVPRGVSSPYVYIDGVPSPYEPSGAWAEVDRFAGGAAFVCNSPTLETYVEYADDPNLKLPLYRDGGYTPWGGYQSGPPIWPLKKTIAFGKIRDPLDEKTGISGDAAFNFYAPEYVFSRTVPEQTLWVEPPVSDHLRPESPPPLNTLCYSNNVGGGGLEISSTWVYESTSGTRDTYRLSCSVTRGGSGYTYEPSVFITDQILSPRRVGGRSDWTDVCCKDYQSSGIAGGWPYTWGVQLSDSGRLRPTHHPPAPVGFGLNIVESSDDARFDNSKRIYGEVDSTSSMLRPHTFGVVKKNGYSTNSGFFFTTSTNNYSSTFWSYYSYPNVTLSHTLTHPSYEVAQPRGDSFVQRTWSRYFGMTRGIYDLDLSTIPTAVKDQLPQTNMIGARNYQLFVPFEYSRELLSPISNRSTLSDRGLFGYLNPTGACYTRSLGDIGGGRNAVLDAPSSFRKLFYYEGVLYGVSNDNDLWRLAAVGGYSTSVPAGKALAEQDKVTIKAWQAECDVTWNWATDEAEVSLMASNAGTLGVPTSPVFSIGSYSQTYLLPPEEDVTINQGYVDVASVYPATSYKIVITNPGQGYKDTDEITFTMRGGAYASLIRKASSFTYTSHETKTVTVELPVISWINDVHPFNRVSVYPLGQGFGFTGSTTRKLTNKPYAKPFWGSGWDQLNDPQFSTQDGSATYISSLSAHLTDGYTVRHTRQPDFTLGTWPQFRQICIRGGGIYMDDSFQITNTVFPQVSEAGDSVSPPFFTQIPEIIISGGSGSGAQAVLLPANRPFHNLSGTDFSSNAWRPYRLSDGLKNLDVVLKDCSIHYGITADGSLRSYDNPLAPPPAGYAGGFDKAECNMGLTSSGDAYYLGHNFSDTSLHKPIAVQNVEYTIEDPGSNYTLWPLVKTQQPSSDVAVVDAVLDGKLVSLGVDNTGHGYESAPTLTLSGGGGSGARAEAIVSGPIKDISLNGGGSGYKAAPKVVFENKGSRASATATSSGFVSSLVLADGGDGYQSKPSVFITGGGGSGATAEVVMLKRVAFIRITGRSGLFTSPPAVSFVGGGGTADAEAEAICQYNESLNRYYVSSIRVTYKGEGYNSVPEVEVAEETDDNGVVSSVSAHAVMDQYVSSVTLNSGGGSYTSAPSVTLIGQSSSQAKVFAMLSMSVDKVELSSPGQYRSPPSVSFEPAGTLQSISLTSGGSGYKTPPRVVVVDTRGLGDGGGGACKIDKSGVITQVVVTSVGRGYDVDYPPTVVFVGGGGSGATASASVEKSGSGASASCRLSASILYAKVTSPGSGYQFSPKVSISGGGNADAATAESMFRDGLISSDERNDLVKDALGKIQSRIEGVISRFDIINPGNYYSSDFRESGYGFPIKVDMTCVPSLAHIVGTARAGVTFNAPTGYPGGPISQPLVMPTQKFFQKPKVVFSNSQDVDVQDFKQATKTSVGTRETKTLPAATTFAEFGYSGLGPRLTNNLIVGWTDPVSGSRKSGWSGLRFEQGKFPEVVFNSESGSGMTASASLDNSGAVQSVSISNAGSGYNVRETRISLSGGVVRHVPCSASCAVSADGRITSVSISSGGSGYISPAVIIHDGCGKGALAAAVSSGGVIQSISILGGGSGYSSSRPPSVLVYETSGYFSESTVGVAFNSGITESFRDLLGSSYPIKWDSYQTEYSPAIPRQDVAYGSVYSLTWDSTSNSDTFGQLTEVTNLTCNRWIETGHLNTRPYSSPPSVSVYGDCDQSLAISSQVVKWSDVFSNNYSGNDGIMDVCGKRDTT
jgi:hypothetical protein